MAAQRTRGSWLLAMRNLPLLVAALGVVALGLVTVSVRHTRTELVSRTRQQQVKKGLLGSTFNSPIGKDGHRVTGEMEGIGNQAAPNQHGVQDVGTNIVFHGVHNEGGIIAARRQHASKKGLVGSTIFDPKAMMQQKNLKPKRDVGSSGIGNQAAGSKHGIQDVGTNIVFHGVHNEGGIIAARRQHASKKGLVGSTIFDPKAMMQQKNFKPKRDVGSSGIGNQAAGSKHGIQDVGTNIVFHGVHNEGGIIAARRQHAIKGLVGSTVYDPSGQGPNQRANNVNRPLVVTPKAKDHVNTGLGNQAAGSMHGVEDIGTNIVFHGVHNEGGIVRVRKHQAVHNKVGPEETRRSV